MNMKYIYVYVIIVFGFLLSADMKIGYIDSNRIMQELDEVREVRVELEKEQRKMESDMQSRIGRRDSLIQAYELQKILLVDERIEEAIANPPILVMPLNLLVAKLDPNME